MTMSSPTWPIRNLPGLCCVRPASDGCAPTVEAHVYPSGDVIPENQLRMYIEFSAPMGRRSGIEYVALLDERGKEVEGPSEERHSAQQADGPRAQGRQELHATGPRRLAGRQRSAAQGIISSHVSRWAARHASARHRAVAHRTPQGWRPVGARRDIPRAGRSRLAVSGARRPSTWSGHRRRVTVGANETQWSFTPHEPWQAGYYNLLALSILEDRAGNQTGRAFEVDNFETVDKGPAPRTVTLPFRVQ